MTMTMFLMMTDHHPNSPFLSCFVSNFASFFSLSPQSYYCHFHYCHYWSIVMMIVMKMVMVMMNFRSFPTFSRSHPSHVPIVQWSWSPHWTIDQKSCPSHRMATVLMLMLLLFAVVVVVEDHYHCYLC